MGRKAAALAKPWDHVREGGSATSDTSPAARSTSPTIASTGKPRTRTAPTGRDHLGGRGRDVRTLTYRELRDEVARLRQRAASRWASARATWSRIYLPNLPEAFVAIHACNRIGAIYTVLFAGFSPDAVGAAAADLARQGGRHRRRQPIGAAARCRCSTICARARANAPDVQHVVVVDRTGAEPDPAGRAKSPIERWSNAQAADCPCLPMEANEPAFLIFTSGTETKPKGVVHSVAGFLVGTWANVQWQIGPEAGRRLLVRRRCRLADLSRSMR